MSGVNKNKVPSHQFGIFQFLILFKMSLLLSLRGFFLPLSLANATSILEYQLLYVVFVNVVFLANDINGIFLTKT